MTSKKSNYSADSSFTFLEQPEHEGAQKLWRYWQDKCGGKPVPDREDISFADLSSIAPNLLISERVPGSNDFRIRLYGSALAEITGEERTGKMLQDIGEERSGRVRDRWRTVTSEAARTGRPVFAKAAGSQEHNTHMVYHGLALPLTNGGEEIEQFIGALFTTYASDEA